MLYEKAKDVFLEDFESSASANFATPAVGEKTIMYFSPFSMRRLVY